MLRNKISALQNNPDIATTIVLKNFYCESKRTNKKNPQSDLNTEQNKIQKRQNAKG